jgi:hypothetical protein
VFAPITLFHNAKNKKEKKKREKSNLVGSIFPTILEPVDFIGFISWSYDDFKSICLVKLCQSF